MKIPRRTLLTGGAAAAAFAGIPTDADAANVPFTTFAFDSTLGNTPRTMPVRLSEIQNVLDWGADPTGATACDSQVQNAVNWTTGPNRGTIYFPQGKYLFNNPVTYNYIGLTAVNSTGSSYNSGTGVVTLNLTTVPTYTQYCSITVSGLTGTGTNLANANGTFTVLSVSGTQITYAIATGLTISTITGGAVVGNLSIRFVGEVNGTFIFGTLSGYLFDRSLGSPNNTTGLRTFEKMTMSNSFATGGGCIRMGSTNGGAIRNCQFAANGSSVTTEDTAGVSSTNIFFQTCHFTSNNTGHLGNDANGIVIGGAGSIEGCYLGSSDTCIRFYGKGLHTAGNRIEVSNCAYLAGLDSAGGNQGASAFSLTSGTMEGDTIGVHLAFGCTGFFIGALAEEGHSSSNSGYPFGANNTQYHLKIDADAAYSGVIQSFGGSNVADVASVSIANATAYTGLVFMDCSCTSSSGSNWNNPTNAYTATFIACNNQPIWAHSALPTTNNVNVFEGNEFNVSDINGGWGTTYTGGGTTHGLVRWNGTAYTVMAT